MIGLIILGVLLAGYWLLLSPFSQALGAFPYRKKTNQKVVALTFDDGPNPPYTTEISSFLHRKAVRATFFQVGSAVERYPAVTRQLVAEGHVVGNHSWGHQWWRYLLQPSFRGELERTQNIIERTIGRRPALFRPPWLFRQPWLLRTVRRMGLQVVSGRFGSAVEIFQPSASWMAERSLAKLRPGAIIIFHDGFDARGGNRSQTAAAVQLFVERALAQGYRFVTVDELLDQPAYRVD